MNTIDLDGFLMKVEKPARYVGTEWNSVHKKNTAGLTRFALAFPDVYEVGMSHLGTKILYHTLNKRSDVVAERVFTPWIDMEREMKQRNIPLFSLESRTPLNEFDIIGFTLQYELSYSNILHMLDMANIPLRSKDRDHSFPLIIGGGPCAFNVEPLAPFFDVIHLGESEEALPEIIAVYRQCQQKAPSDREFLLQSLAKIQGIYIPSFYEADYHADGTVKELKRINAAALPKITKAVVNDLDRVDFPTDPIVPFIEIIHDRMMLEVFRGCTRGCRFCQAGMIYRPVRERSRDELLQQAEELIRNTGYDEISLTSLNTSDYSDIEDLVQTMVARYGCERIGLSLPSSRVDSFSVKLLEEIQKVRKSGLTLAPEAGSQRLRDVINKNVSEHDYLSAVEDAFTAGWSGVKLYFMIGLPTETEEDIAGIADLAVKAVHLYQQVIKNAGSRRKPLRVTLSVASFVPKPHTPFQWEPQDSIETLKHKQQFLKGLLKHKAIHLNWHDAEVSFLEAVFARGDRRLADVLEKAWQLGCKFDGWTELYRHDLWLQAFRDTGTDPHFYANRRRSTDEVLPWDHLDTGVRKDFLIRERDLAFAEKTSPDCRFEYCLNCGVCPDLNVAIDVKGGKQNE